MEGVVRAAIGSEDFLRVFDFDLLSVRIFLLLMSDVPAQGLPEFVDEGDAGLRFGVAGGKIVGFVFRELADGSVRRFEGVARHGIGTNGFNALVSPACPRLGNAQVRSVGPRLPWIQDKVRDTGRSFSARVVDAGNNKYFKRKAAGKIRRLFIFL